MFQFQLLPVLANKVMQNKGLHTQHRDFDLDQEHFTAAPPSINQSICFKEVQIICYKEVDSLSIVALIMFMLCSRRVIVLHQELREVKQSNLLKEKPSGSEIPNQKHKHNNT